MDYHELNYKSIDWQVNYSLSKDWTSINYMYKDNLGHYNYMNLAEKADYSRNLLNKLNKHIAFKSELKINNNMKHHWISDYLEDCLKLI